MADAPIPKLPDTKRLEFLAFMIWVGLIGAILILAIDYQIKQAILQASAKAWEGIDAFKAEQRGFGNPASSTSGHAGSNGFVHGTEMETRALVEGVSDPSATRSAPVRRASNPRRGKGNPVIPPRDKPVDS